MRKILVSACLLGINCRYDGKEKPNEEVQKLLKQEGIHLIPICPEQLGGLPTPRVPSEVNAERKVYTKDGRDVTKEYQRGAEAALKFAELYGCREAILKERSPSCGLGKIYDGTFTGSLTEGNGITAELLSRHGIRIMGESEVKNI